MLYRLPVVYATLALVWSACGPSPPPPYVPPPAPAAAELVREIARVRYTPACARATQCPRQDSVLDPFPLSDLRFFFASQEQCAAELPDVALALEYAPLLDALAEGRIFYDEASASTCARALEELQSVVDEDPCAPAVVGLGAPAVCRSPFQGLVRPGGACASSAECQAGLVCEADVQGTCPGVCIETRISGPENPDQLLGPSELFCGGQLCSLGKVCSPAGLCVVQKEAGQVCTPEADVCAFGSTCRVLANASSGLCAADRSVPDGEFCSASAQCAAASVCAPVSDADPRTVCQIDPAPPRVVELGEPCDLFERLCPFGAVCGDANTCEAIRSDAQLPGAACMVDADCLSFECSQGACADLAGCSI
ncbi:MAG: hypothetical protein AAGI01_03125 [Myxococcota bacterium]